MAGVRCEFIAGQLDRNDGHPSVVRTDIHVASGAGKHLMQDLLQG